MSGKNLNQKKLIKYLMQSPNYEPVIVAQNDEDSVLYDSSFQQHVFELSFDYAYADDGAPTDGFTITCLHDMVEIRYVLPVFNPNQIGSFKYDRVTSFILYKDLWYDTKKNYLRRKTIKTGAMLYYDTK